MPQDYYIILGVERVSDADTIKKAYRKIAMQFHPDKNPGDAAAEAKFKEAAEAYGVLGDAEKRARYDRFGHAAFQGAGGGGGFGGFQNAEDIFSQFGDIFGDIFGMGGGGQQRQRRSRTGPQKGADLRYLTEITLKEVLTGVEQDLDFESEVSCDSCEGKGAEKGSEVSTCPTCQGSGQVVRNQGFFTMASTCGTCRGEGQVIKNPCKKCKGRGRIMKNRKLRVSIPAGVDTGTRLRITGEGESGTRGGPDGDLYVEIRVREQENFERDGDNLHSPLKVSYVQLILGAEIEVPTVGGKAKLKIPRSTKPGEDLRLPGEGLPSLRGRRRGDLFVRIIPEFPKTVSKEEEKLLRQIAEIRGLSIEDESRGLFGRKK